MKNTAIRDFMIERYSPANWNQIKGLSPFIVTGSRFNNWIIPGSLEKYKEYKFKKNLATSLSSISGSDDFIRDCISEILLREEILQAFWCASSRECLPADRRWLASIKQISDEIGDGPIIKWTIELLSGMNDLSHLRSYVSDDELILEPSTIPSDGY